MAKAKKNRIKQMQKQRDYFHRQSRSMYSRMRIAELTLQEYEENVAGQITILTSKYEGIICYLLEKYAGGEVSNSDVAEWAKDKEYVLEGKAHDQDIVWKAVVREVETDDTNDGRGVSGDDRTDPQISSGTGEEGEVPEP